MERVRAFVMRNRVVSSCSCCAGLTSGFVFGEGSGSLITRKPSTDFAFKIGLIGMGPSSTIAVDRDDNVILISDIDFADIDAIVKTADRLAVRFDESSPRGSKWISFLLADLDVDVLYLSGTVLRSAFRQDGEVSELPAPAEDHLI